MGQDLPTDIYWRYHPIAKFVEKQKIDSILEIGGLSKGITSILSKRVFGVAPEFENSDTPLVEWVKGRNEALPFKANCFDLVFSVDVFEHIPRNFRKQSIQEMLRVSRRFVIIAFPTGNKAAESEKKVIEYYRKQFNREHVWLKEHLMQGLPKIEEIKHILKKFDYKQMKNLNLWVWRNYFKTVFFLSKSKAGRHLLNILSRLLIKPLADFINFGDCYRTIIIIDKKYGAKN